VGVVGSERTTALLLVGVVLTAGLAGCTQEPQPDPNPSGPFSAAIVAATRSGVDASQVEILERANSLGEVTFEDLREAVSNTYSCLDGHNIQHTETISTAPWGSQTLRYDMRVPSTQDTDAAVALADECARLFSGAVETLYSSQPVEVARQDTWRAEFVVPALRACLDDAEVPYDLDADFAELNDVAFAAAAGGGNQQLKECVVNISETGF
jgi:hypothetical protein